MTVRDLVKKGTEVLKHSEVEAPVFESGVILCHVLNCDRSWLYAHMDYNVDPSAAEEFESLIKMRKGGTPLQYITGSQEFMSLDFTVNRHVLIPRQETEILVEEVIKQVRADCERGSRECAGKKEGVFILDIGTGSGCIAVSLAFYLPQVRVLALDISKEALAVASHNARKNGVAGRIQFVESDMFDGIEGREFDIIVSNPPYIPDSELKDLKAEVKDYEPILALKGGADGLFFYRRIAKDAAKFLKPHGLLFLETGYNQADTVSRILDECFYDITVVKDLAGIKRVVWGKRKK